ncbi:MAG: twin-arginine translocase subunit TatC [Planctomycetota bacterium]|jgi:sec-independent protein translocase protein TatC
MGDKKKKKNQYEPGDTTMSLGDHLEELRMRLMFAIGGLVLALIICLFFCKPIIFFIKGPYVDVMGEDAKLLILAPADGFVTYMKIALIAGLMISCPWVFYHLWMFVAAGLYEKERRYVRMAVPFSAGLFIGGACFFIFIVAPLTLGFLVKFNDWLGFDSSFTFQKYVSFVATLTLVFGIAFQTPIAIFFLTKTGLVSIKGLRNSRPYVVLGVFVVAAMATPPDPTSQVMLAIPLYLLFELGIILSYLSERRKKVESSD